MSRRGLGRILLNGRFTCSGGSIDHASYEDAIPQKSANYWASTENSRNNAWNVNSNDGNTNGNNKYNSLTVRAAVAYGGFREAIKAVCEAYLDCKRGKMSSTHTIAYMEIATEDLPKLAYEIYMAIYLPTISICFLVKYPKLREVFAADFRDRIVHHWIIIRLEPLFEKRFRQMGNISFNCRKGFGTLAAVRAAEKGMREVSENYTRQAWVFKGDLVSFFMSIRRNLLWYLLERFIRRHYNGGDKEILLRTVKTVIFHHPEDDCIINGDPKEWQKLPKSKSMFTIDRNLGGPIGNHTTQQFANFYLSILFDIWLLFLMRGANFRIIRFVDDFLIICDDKDKILQVVPRLVAVTSIYGIHIHNDKKYLQPVGHGVLFVGGYIKPGRTYVSSRTIGRFQERVSGFRKQLDENRNLTYYDLERIEQVINSYLGFCVHHQTYMIRKKSIINLGNNFWKYFYVKGHYESIRIKPDYRIF